MKNIFTSPREVLDKIDFKRAPALPIFLLLANWFDFVKAYPGELLKPLVLTVTLGIAVYWCVKKFAEYLERRDIKNTVKK